MKKQRIRRNGYSKRNKRLRLINECVKLIKLLFSSYKIPRGLCMFNNGKFSWLCCNKKVPCVKFCESQFKNQCGILEKSKYNKSLKDSKKILS